MLTLYQVTGKAILKIEFLWFNNNIKVDNWPIFFKHFSEKRVNFVSHIMKENGKIKSLNEVRTTSLFSVDATC